MARCHRSTRRVGARLVVLGLLLGACQGEPVSETSSLGAQVHRVELGRHLFYERRLSLEGNRSCGICHEPALGFTDGFVRAVGTTDELHPRNTLTLTNVGRRESLTWVPGAPESLEEQALIPLLGQHPVEMGMADSIGAVVDSFQVDEVYHDLFPQAFPEDPEPFTLDRVAEAIAAFERTIVSESSPFDRFVEGESQALSDEEQRGLDLFFSHRLRCASCHAGPDLDQPTEDGSVVARHGWFNVGLYDVDGQGAYPEGDGGRFELTGLQEDMGRFRTPTLRNVELTAPYYHDGSGATLADVIANYAAGGRVVVSGPNPGDGRENPYKSDLVRGFELSEQEALDLEAFLRSLTDWEMVEDPALSDPWPRE
jgi:cytochrome c peroxidase